MVDEPNFVIKWFLNSLAKKGTVAFLALLGSLSVAPTFAPVLSKLGITIATVAGVTTITIIHATFAAGFGAVAFMILEALRVWSAKHPASPFSDKVKQLL